MKPPPFKKTRGLLFCVFLLFAYSYFVIPTQAMTPVVSMEAMVSDERGHDEAIIGDDAVPDSDVSDPESSTDSSCDEGEQNQVMAPVPVR